MSKETILSAVRESLNSNDIRHDKLPHTRFMKLTYNDLLEEYKVNQINNKTIIREASLDTLLDVISGILEENDSKKVLYNTDLPLNLDGLNARYLMVPYLSNVDSMREELFSIDTSVVKARCGVANLGIVGLSSNVESPRLSSLITNTCIYLLSREDIVETLYDGVSFIKQYEEQRTGTKLLPTNIIFVAGPSRTADIELQNVFGVHGPRVTYVVLY